jgi:integrase/recombinase XerC
MDHDELIEGYLTHLRELNRRPGTITTRRQMLTRHDRELPYGLAEANEDELRRAIFRADWDVRTQVSHLSGLRSFYAWAVRRQELDFDPSAGITRPHISRRLPRPVTDGQLADILARAAEPYRLWALLAAGEGMRCCEVSAADREHVTESAVRVHGKGGKERIVPTHPAVWQAVRDLPPGPLARNENGTRASAHSVSQLAACHFDDLGLPDVTLHRFRHWFGTSTLDACGNLRTVQELMGHASPESTAVYTQVSPQARAAAVAALPVLTAAA